MIKNNCMYTSSKKVAHRSNNSFAITKEGQFILIKGFIVDPIQQKELTVSNRVNTVDITFDDENLSSIKKIVTISEEVLVIETSSIDKICVQISINKNNKFILPVPNLYSY